jgi:Fe-S oxidoreductase
VVRTPPPTESLRLGPHYAPPDLPTHFRFPEDGYGFADAANRCFGVGNCRHVDGGTMCPSFMVTREERHSTRGRARMLFEMMREAGERRHPWRDEGVKDALDLCLACKGCKGDCPVRVDMATYKAEFLSHYYEGRVRPRAAYALGLIQRWSRLAAMAPGPVNALTHAPVVTDLVKGAAGVAHERALPRFTDRTFRAWDRQRRPANPQGREVLLWTDTFTDHFEPHVAMSAVEVLEAAGLRVRIPPRPLCCGRPLYDYGMLPTAKRYLRRILDELGPDIEAGVPVVGLEPSCVAVFRDELPNLFPHDQNALRLATNTWTVAQAIDRLAPDWSAPRIERDALVQVHCHQGAILGYDAERALLERAGVRLTVPDSGCCGMAGSFGYEAGEKYDVSVACGERVILPQVRGARPDTVVVADGFSCREQIGQLTDRTAVHSVELLAAALDPPDPRQPTAHPERRIRARLPRPYGAGPAPRHHLRLRPAAAGVLTALTATALVRRRRHHR